MLVLLTLFTLTVIAGAAGWKAARLRPNPATVVAAGFCIPLAIGGLFAKHPSWIPEFLITRWLAEFESSWFAPFAAGLFLLAARQSSARQATKAAAKRIFILIVVLMIVVLGAASFPFVLRMQNENWVADQLAENPNGIPIAVVDSDGVVRQTTRYTCGPCACATLLRRLGIDPDASEAQMVPLCLTRRNGGTTPICLAVGLKSVAAPKGWRVRIIEPGDGDLEQIKTPFLCSVEFARFVGHAVVVCEFDSRLGVKIADPITGMKWWPMREFRSGFLKEALCLYKNSPGVEP